MAKKCFLCESTDCVNDFNDEIWRHCLLKLAFRKTKKFKYNNIQLPNVPDNLVGYHTNCYKKVTALKCVYNEEYKNFIRKYEESISTKKEDSNNPDSNVQSCTVMTDGEDVDVDASTPIHVDLDEVPSTSTASTSENEDICLFCNRKQKKSGKQIYNVVFPAGQQTVQKIRTIAENLSDSEILSKLQQMTVAYHKSCYATYLTKEKRFTDKHTDSNWHKYRKLHESVFKSISDFIGRKIIENNEVMYFSQIFARYQSLLMEYTEYEMDFDDIQYYRSEMLEKKVSRTFGDQVTIAASGGPRKKKIIFKKDMDISIIASNIKVLETQSTKKLEDVAYNLRNCIKNINRNPLPHRLTANDVIRGECEIPERLFDFMQTVIVGPNLSEEDCNISKVKIRSICSDIIYAVTKGRCKPTKNLTLGLAVKSLTNSRQVITMLNRYGHSIGYNLAEELETEMTYTSLEDNKIIPTGITAANGYSTHVAFDNFDRFVDTTSGRDTMHDTVGIIYQFSAPESDGSHDTAAITSVTPARICSEDEVEPLRKRRRFNEIVPEIRPYYSKPSTNERNNKKNKDHYNRYYE